MVRGRGVYRSAFCFFLNLLTLKSTDRYLTIQKLPVILLVIVGKRMSGVRSRATIREVTRHGEATCSGTVGQTQLKPHRY